jgi:hypothetical protein
VAVIQILAWVGMLQSLQGLNSSVLQARDRTGDLLKYGIVVCTASLTAFVLGLQWGLIGVAVAYAISSTLVEPYYTWLTARALGISVFAFPRALAGVVQAVLGMAVAITLVRVLLSGRVSGRLRGCSCSSPSVCSPTSRSCSGGRPSCEPTPAGCAVRALRRQPSSRRFRSTTCARKSSLIG